MKIPVYFKFRATDVRRAFTLNAMISAIVVVLGATFKDALDLVRLPKSERKDHPRTSWGSVFISMILTFFTALVVYWLMYFLFAFGGGMLMEGAPPIEQYVAGSRIRKRKPLRNVQSAPISHSSPI